MLRIGRDYTTICLFNEIGEKPNKYKPMDWQTRVNLFWGVPTIVITPDEEMRRTGRVFKKSTQDIIQAMKDSKPPDIPLPEEIEEAFEEARLAAKSKGKGKNKGKSKNQGSSKGKGKDHKGKQQARSSGWRDRNWERREWDRPTYYSDRVNQRNWSWNESWQHRDWSATPWQWHSRPY